MMVHLKLKHRIYLHYLLPSREDILFSLPCIRTSTVPLLNSSTARNLAFDCYHKVKLIIGTMQSCVQFFVVLVAVLVAVSYTYKYNYKYLLQGIVTVHNNQSYERGGGRRKAR
jgi:hypothetical protein